MSRSSVGCQRRDHSPPLGETGTDTPLARSVEDALRESEDRFRAIAESASDWFWEMDSSLRFVYISERFFEVTGQPASLFIGKTRQEVAAQFGGDLEQAKWRHHLDDLVNRRAFRDFEYEIAHPEGHWITIHLNGKPRFAPDGAFLGFIGTGTDVTRLRRAEESQRQTLQELQAIFTNASVGIVYSLGNEVRRCNHRVEAILGYAPNELAGVPGVSLFPDVAAYKAFVKASAPLLDNGRTHSADSRLRRKDGSLVWCRYFAQPLDLDRAESGVVWIVEDIEQEWNSREQLRIAMHELEAMMANAPVGILITRDRVMVHHNRKFAETFGFVGDEAVGRPARLLCRSDEEYEEMVRVAAPLLSAAQPFQTEMYMRRQNGSDLWMNVIGYVSDPGHPTQGAVWILDDRTAFKRADEALRRSHEELEARVAERTAELSQQLHLLNQLIGAIPGPVFYKDAQCRYLGCNRAFEAVVGKPRSELIGKRSRDIAPPELAEQYLAADRELLEKTGFQIYEGQVRYANGELRDVMFHKATFSQPDGTVGGLVGVMLDITERKRMEDHLRQAATVFESAAEGVIITRPDGSIIAVNRAFSEITGYDASEVIGRNPRMLQSGHQDRGFYREMWESIVRTGRWQGELWNRRKNGELFPEWISLAAVRDAQGRLTNYVATFSDLTLPKRSEERIQQLAFSDPLTHLPNRRLLLERLQHALATSCRSKRRSALFFIDLDDFKDLNDTLGHDKGDLLLQQVAQRLRDCVRESDTVARLGGDEFVVMLEDLSEVQREASSQAEAVGKKILTALNQVYSLGEHLHHSTPSIGVTLFGDKPSSVDELLKQTDLAMYQAKGSGRNALRFFDAEMQTVVAARVAMEADLRKSLLERHFVLHYQPQVDHLGRVFGAEALVRWQHPLRGMVSPAEFIPLAEETGLIVPLGLWVLETACAQLSIWAKTPAAAHLTLAVNVSARQFRQADFVDQLLAALENSGADPRRLKLELTESMLLKDVEEINTRMTLLKNRGVGFSLDDFGTGYSSLAYLRRLPFDQLKIDKSFVGDVLTDPNDAVIARTIVSLAHSLGLNVIAEGVETQEQLAFLAAHDCHAYQGYLFGKPGPEILPEGSLPFPT